MALSNDIVRQHGGSIRVESVDGEFTEMIIELPLTKPEVLVIEESDGDVAGDNDYNDDEGL